MEKPNIAHRIVMIEVLLQAQHKSQFVSRNGERIWLERGQAATSYQKKLKTLIFLRLHQKFRGAVEKLVNLVFGQRMRESHGQRKESC